MLLTNGYVVKYRGNMSDDNNTIDITKIQEQQRRIENEQNVLLQPLWRSVMNIKTPRQAISCASAMIVAGKDLLVLELGADVAKNFIDNLNTMFFPSSV